VTRGLLGVLLGFAVLATVAKPVSAQSAEEVQAMVERAAEHIREYGQQQAFADFSRPDGGFVKGDLYVFCDNAEGVVVAHGGNPKLIGKNLGAVRDPEGKLRTREIFQFGQTKGKGWVEYLWPNPQDGRVRHKQTYVIRIDDQTVCASGYFRPDQP
jgi:cytochrome c